MPRPRKKVEEVKQTNGALTQPKTVYDIIGKRTSNYTTGSFEEYKTTLKAMNLSELQRHAIEIANIVPIDDRTRLEDRLEKEFLRTQAKFGQIPVTSPTPVSEKDRDSLLKILSRTH